MADVNMETGEGLAQLAYEAYTARFNPSSYPMITNPGPWGELDPRVRNAWRHGVNAVTYVVRQAYDFVAIPPLAEVFEPED